MSTNRTVTSKSTVPAGVAADGTVTSVSTDSTILTRSTYTIWISALAYTAGELAVFQGAVWENTTGVNTTTNPLTDKTNWKKYTAEWRKNVWIYLPTDGAGNQKVAKIVSIGRVLDEAASTYVELYYMQTAISTTGAVAFEFVVGNVKEYGIDNKGAADATVDGFLLIPNRQFTEDTNYVATIPQVQDVISVDGTGTTLIISEHI